MYHVRNIICLFIISLNVPVAMAAERVIHISVDGLYAEAISILGDTRLPSFALLKTKGASTLSARTDTDFTNTLPNHASQFTGRRVNANLGGHGWDINYNPGSPATLHTNAGKYISGIFDVVHDAGKSTSLFAGKSKFSIFNLSWNGTYGAGDAIGEDNGKDKIDRYVYNENTTSLVLDFISDLQATTRHYAFLHIRDPDSIGHTSGWDWDIGSDYMNTVMMVDGYLGQIISFVEADPNYANNTTIILTSDHGGKNKGTSHKPDTPESHIIPFYVWGSDVAQGVSLYDMNICTAEKPAGTVNPPYSGDLNPIRNGDAANLAARLLNVKRISNSQIETVLHLKPNPGSQSCATTNKVLPSIFFLL